ncbi:MAG: helix-turn-helix domain-containing protein [Sedimentibacter sp.]|uniref:helix-turn-helix domain-containing protein n=1 Tax=Sedimentibacter sp. TaxID=1960295 RepID=UPI00315800DC
MNREYYTVEQISNMLDIHPKTIQRYIREGRLRASKVGKGWRINGHDLSVFVESDSNKEYNTEKQSIHSALASSVIDIKVYGKEDAIRIMNTLSGALNSKPKEYGQSSMQSQYIECENMIRVTLWGDIRFMAVMMDTISVLIEQQKE